MRDTLDAHVATKNNIEAHFTSDSVRAGLETDVVDVCVGEVVAGTGYGDVELTRHIRPDIIMDGKTKKSRYKMRYIVYTGAKTQNCARFVLLELTTRGCPDRC
jgi:hypothetical protein